MTDTTTSQNIDLSSWDTCFKLSSFILPRNTDIPTFRKNVLPSLSGSKYKPIQQEAISKLSGMFLVLAPNFKLFWYNMFFLDRWQQVLAEVTGMYYVVSKVT
jgi:hypothetical protein